MYKWGDLYRKGGEITMRLEAVFCLNDGIYLGEARPGTWLRCAYCGDETEALSAGNEKERDDEILKE